MNNLPVRYKALVTPKWKNIPGRVFGSAQPGYLINSEHDNNMLKLLLSGKSISEAKIDNKLLLNLKAIYKQGIRTIYSLASFPSDRKPELIKHLWESLFDDTNYILTLNDLTTEIKDFHAPTLKQLQNLVSDALKRITNGEKILIHCGAGVGRTGTFLTAIHMQIHGEYNVEECIQLIRKNYNSQSVEGELQRKALQEFSNHLQTMYIKDNPHSDNSLKFAVNLDLRKEALIALKNGADITAAFKNEINKNKALIFTINNKLYSEALELIKIGANINSQNELGDSILSIAIKEGNIEIIDQLLTFSEIDLEIKNDKNISPIMQACINKNYDIIWKLIQKGCPLKEAKTLNNDELFQYWKKSLDEGNLRAINNLAKFNVDLNTYPINGMSALKYAQKNKELYVGMASLRIGSDHRNELKQSLIEAKYLISTYPQMTRNLILSGANLNNLDIVLSQKKLTEFLKEAIDNANLFFLMNLISYDKNIKNLKIKRVSALQYAIVNNHYELAIKMSEIGFSNDNQYSNLTNALNLAITYQNNKEVKRLITAGANVNAKFNDIPLLIKAIHTKNPIITNLLIEGGANIRDSDKNGKTVLMHAIDVDIIEILNPILKSLKPADLKVADKNNKTAIMHAVSATAPFVIKELIDHGADINQVVNDSTALMESVILKKPSILKILIKNYNADVNLSDISGITPLKKAKNSNIIKILVENGAI